MGPTKDVTKEAWAAAFQEYSTTGNIANACQKYGVNRRRFREKLERFRESGPEGLEDLRHAKEAKTSGPAYYNVVAAALRNERNSSKMISCSLRLNGVKISPSSIQRILRKEGLTSKKAKIERLEMVWNMRDHPLHDQIFGDRFSRKEAIDKIATINPRVRMYKSRSTIPGARVVHDVHLIGVFFGKKYFCNMAIDTCSSFVVATLQITDTAKEDFEFLALKTHPAFAKIGAPILEIITDLNPRYDRLKDRLKERLEERLKAEVKCEHSRERCARRAPLGFVDHFVRRVRTDFFNGTIPLNISNSFEEINEEFQHWLRQYNRSSSEGFPNYGMPPLQFLLNNRV